MLLPVGFLLVKGNTQKTGSNHTVNKNLNHELYDREGQAYTVHPNEL